MVPKYHLQILLASPKGKKVTTMEKPGCHNCNPAINLSITDNNPDICATDVTQYEVHRIIYEIFLPKLFNLKLIKFLKSNFQFRGNIKDRGTKA